MEQPQASGRKAGAASGLPVLLVVVATAGVTAGAAAWWWAGDRPSPAALAPTAGARVAEPVTLPSEVLRSPLAAPAPRSTTVAGVTARRAASEDSEAPRQDPGESEHYARFLALAAEDMKALEYEAALVLSGGGDDCEKVALLRALESSGSPRSYAWLEHALTSLPDSNRAGRDTVPGFALGRLMRAADSDARARAALERVALGTARAPDRLRRVAAASFAASATESELWRLAASLSNDSDEPLRASVHEALSRNRSPAAVAAVFGHGHDGLRQESAGNAQE